MSVAQLETMTTEQILALPEDGVERELIYGQPRERPVTRRKRRHSRTEVRISHALAGWLDTQPEPCGEIVGGEAGFRLPRDPDTTVGIDVAYVSDAVAAHHPESVFPEAPPYLAVEIVPPSDTQEGIDEKVSLYLGLDIAVVRVVNPRHRTILVFRQDCTPTLFNDDQVIDAEPHVPGFSAPLSSLF